VSYRPYLESGALRQMHGLPERGFDMLVTLLARICDDPYDPVFSAPTGVPRRRVADVGDFGFIVFVVDEPAGLVRVFLPRLDRLRPKSFGMGSKRTTTLDRLWLPFGAASLVREQRRCLGLLRCLRMAGLNPPAGGGPVRKRPSFLLGT
jgi:hypothetical protein